MNTKAGKRLLAAAAAMMCILMLTTQSAAASDDFYMNGGTKFALGTSTVDILGSWRSRTGAACAVWGYAVNVNDNVPAGASVMMTVTRIDTGEIVLADMPYVWTMDTTGPMRIPSTPLFCGTSMVTQAPLPKETKLHLNVTVSAAGSATATLDQDFYLSNAFTWLYTGPTVNRNWNCNNSTQAPPESATSPCVVTYDFSAKAIRGLTRSGIEALGVTRAKREAAKAHVTLLPMQYVDSVRPSALIPIAGGGVRLILYVHVPRSVVKP